MFAARISPGPAGTDKLIPVLYVQPPYIACVVVAVAYNRTTEMRDPAFPYQSHLANTVPVRCGQNSLFYQSLFLPDPSSPGAVVVQ